MYTISAGLSQFWRDLRNWFRFITSTF